MQKLRVCVISSGWIPLPPDKGGAVENYVCNVVKYCRKLGINAIAIDSQINKEKVKESEIRFEGDCIPVIRLPVLIPRFTKIVPWVKSRNQIVVELSFGKTIAKKLSKFIDYDLIHINNGYVGFAFAVFNRDSKFVYTCHNPLWPEDSVYFKEKIVRDL